MPTEIVKEQFITKSNIKSNYGFSDKMIEKYLTLCDKEVCNPYYANAASMKLFSVSRVEKLLELEEVKKELEDRVKKQETIKKSNNKSKETKINNIIKYVSELNIDIGIIMEREKLTNLAINSYNDFNLSKGYDNFASKYADDDFLNRITVNFIRHNITNYECLLDEVFSKAYKNYGIELIRKKIYNLIGSNYPWLKEECNKQFEARKLL